MELTGGNTGKDTDNNSTVSEFDISITLTDLGLQNYKTVRKDFGLSKQCRPRSDCS